MPGKVLAHEREGSLRTLPLSRLNSSTFTLTGETLPRTDNPCAGGWRSRRGGFSLPAPAAEKKGGCTFAFDNLTLDLGLASRCRTFPNHQGVHLWRAWGGERERESFIDGMVKSRRALLRIRFHTQTEIQGVHAWSLSPEEEEEEHSSNFSIMIVQASSEKHTDFLKGC